MTTDDELRNKLWKEQHLLMVQGYANRIGTFEEAYTRAWESRNKYIAEHPKVAKLIEALKSICCEYDGAPMAMKDTAVNAIKHFNEAGE